MHVIGAEGIRVIEGRPEPTGVRHAVIPQVGQMLCGPRVARYVFPALSWADGSASDDACPLCAEALAPALAYPEEPRRETSTAEARW